MIYCFVIPLIELDDIAFRYKDLINKRNILEMDNDSDHVISYDTIISSEAQRKTTKDELVHESVVVRPSMLPLVCYKSTEIFCFLISYMHDFFIYQTGNIYKRSIQIS